MMTVAVRPTPLVLYVAEDDEDDRLLLEEAIEELQVPLELSFAGHGLELMSMLRRTHPEVAPLVLLDLNMPLMSGQEVLSAVRSDPGLRATPIVVLSTSDQREEVDEVYALGANTFFTKPSSFDELVELVRVLVDYWQTLALRPTVTPGATPGSSS